MDITQILIDEEFEGLLPQQTEEEFAGLRSAITVDGFTDPLVVWEEKEILVDGHNRYRVWELDHQGKTKHVPPIVAKSFASRAEVMEWMIKHQNSRRNWTKKQRDEAIRKLHAELVKPEGAPKGNSNASAEKPGEKQRPQNDDVVSEAPKKTREKVAETFGVSPATVDRAVADGKKNKKKKTDNAHPLQPILDRKKEFAALVNKVGAIRTAMEKIKDEPCGRLVNFSNIIRDCENLQSGIKFAAPFAVCPYCKGKGCNPCKSLGWMNKLAFDKVPKDKRDEAA